MEGLREIGRERERQSVSMVLQFVLKRMINPSL